MDRYDPPVTVTYDDIKIANEGDSDTINQVSKTLNSSWLIDIKTGATGQT